MIGPFVKSIARATNNSLRDDYVEATAQKLDRVVRDFEGSENPSDEMLYDFENYVDVLTQYTVKKDNADLEDVLEFERLKRLVDPNQSYRNQISSSLSDVRSLVKITDKFTKESKALPEEITPLAKVAGDALLDGRSKALSPFVTKEAKQKIGANVLNDLLELDTYKPIIESIARRMPENQTIDELQASAKERAQNKVDFTRNSVEKKPQFRATTSHHDLPYDISFAYPRELGTHVGTLGQATSIAVQGINPYSDIGRYLDSRLVPTQKSDVDQFFGSQKMVEIKDVVDKPMKASRPAAMSKGYINVKNPLKIDYDVKEWSAEYFLVDQGQKIYDSIVKQAGNLASPQLKKDFTDLIKTAQEITDTEWKKGLGLDSAMRISLQKVELNFKFQKLLQRNGFDSVRYKNEVEASLKGEPKYSYILFKPEQFKSTTAKSYDKGDPRFTFNEGGPVGRSQSAIPLNIKAFIGDLLGYDTPITEEHLDEEEYQSLIEITRRVKEAGKSAIEYADYQTQSEGRSQYADIGGGGGNLDFLKKVFDPKYSLKTTLGQASIEEDSQGNTIIKDRYNFNNASGDMNAIDFLKGVKSAGTNIYAQARNVATALGSAPGEGSEVVINLGRLDS